jgi:hypothetical protein
MKSTTSRHSTYEGEEQAIKATRKDIPEVVGFLWDEAKRLSGLLAELEQRLTPVLRPRPVLDADADGEQVKGCRATPLGIELESIAGSLNVTHAVLCDLLKRLEL